MLETKEHQLVYAKMMLEEMNDDNFKKVIAHLEKHFDSQWLIQFQHDSARIIAHRRDLDRRMAEYRKCPS